MDPGEIFKSEAEEAFEKTQKATEICTKFKEEFEECRKNVKKFFKEGQQIKLWEFANNLVFTRMDLFIRRLEIVKVQWIVFFAIGLAACFIPNSCRKNLLFVLLQCFREYDQGSAFSVTDTLHSSIW